MTLPDETPDELKPTRKERVMATTIEESRVENVSLALDLDRRVALADVRIGEVLIKGIAVWKSPHGKLRVHFPSYRLGAGWADAIYLPEELRAEVEADVIAAYRTAVKEAKAEGA